MYKIEFYCHFFLFIKSVKYPHKCKSNSKLKFPDLKKKKKCLSIYLCINVEVSLPVTLLVYCFVYLTMSSKIKVCHNHSPVVPAWPNCDKSFTPLKSFFF